MPSPFPGMDPFLEDPALWPDVHHQLISTVREILGHSLSPKYSVRIEERVFISDESDPGRQMIIPHERVVHRGATKGMSQATGATTAALIEPIEVITFIEEELHESRLEVVDRTSRSVVTVIEILSPANKIRGSGSRRSYEDKRLEVMRSPSNFIEIDLLRGMEGFPPYDVLPPHDYRVHVSRASRRPKGKLWPILLEQRLPKIPIPLLPDDADGQFDLQSALDLAYDRALYQQEIDYRAEPVLPLTLETAQWVDALLKEKRLR